MEFHEGISGNSWGVGSKLQGPAPTSPVTTTNPKNKVFSTLIEYFKNDDLAGFISEYHRIYGIKPGAVALWQDFSLMANALGEIPEDEDTWNETEFDDFDVWNHPDAIDRGWITKRWEDSLIDA